MDHLKRTLLDLSLRYGPKLLSALVVFLLGLFIARKVGKVAQRWLATRQLEPPVRMLIVRLVSLAVLLLFSIMAIQNLGVELLPLLASLGVAGVGVGLAMQGVLSNVAAGLTIIFTRPFRVGEYIELVGVQGQVETIDIFSTTLVHLDLSRVVIPNRKIVGEIIHNHGKMRQLDLRVSVAYAADLGAAMAVLRQVLAANPRVLAEPVALIGVGSLGHSSVMIEVKPWVAVADYAQTSAELNRAMVEALRAARIEIQVPQQEVRIVSAPAGLSLVK
jgi:small conductance mechanosensitive channel